MSGTSRLRWLASHLIACLLLAGCSGSSNATPSPLAGSKIDSANKEPVRQSEECAPEANPLALVMPAMVRITTPPDAKGAYASGTGVVIDQGWVLTNQHVVDSAGDALVKLFYADGHQSPGKVVASDADLDLALVQANTGDLRAVVWGDEAHLQQGAPLFAVGYAFGNPNPMVSSGRYVTTIVDRPTGQAFIESDLRLEHGDSGGPLLNRCGQVIGVNTARISGTSGQTAGLSIPGFGARRWANRNRPQ